MCDFASALWFSAGCSLCLFSVVFLVFKSPYLALPLSCPVLAQTPPRAVVEGTASTSAASVWDEGAPESPEPFIVPSEGNVVWEQFVLFGILQQERGEARFRDGCWMAQGGFFSLLCTESSSSVMERLAELAVHMAKVKNRK